ncbi:MAG: hypothetical protein JWM77_3690 [Rhodospirillales bacterium]|nr:hypothetical protein [Rhodospirillales bacterium]
MWANLFITGLRVLWKDRLYAAIKLAGLAVALATATLIALWVRYELTWDPYLEDPARVRIIVTHFDGPTSRGFASFAGPANLGPRLAERMPADSVVARYQTSARVLSTGVIRSNEKIAFVDAGFFRVVTLPFLAGDPRTALATPTGLVLSAGTARKLFGTVDVLGRTLELDGKSSFEVTGILRDVPANANFEQGAYAGAAAMGSPLPAAEKEDRWDTISALTVVRLGPEGAAALQPALAQIGQKEFGPEDSQSGGRRSFTVHGLREAQLDGIGEARGADHRTITTIAGVGLLILALATVNFISLSMARSTHRIREVGIRMSVGAGRSRLVLLFLVEPIFLALGAALLAFVAVETSLATVSSAIGTDLSSPYLHGLWIVPAIIGLALAVGLIAGAYPAIALSGLRPVHALRGEGLGNGHALRQILVVAQFGIAVALVISTFFVQRQAEFARELNLSEVAGDPLVVLSRADRLTPSERDLLLTRLAASPSLRGASGTSLVQGDPKHSRVTRSDILVDQLVAYSQIATDGSFFFVQGQALLAGRTLDPARDAPGKVMRAVFNESAARAFGFPRVEEIVGQNFGGTLEAIGVVPDLPLQSAREATGPTLFFYEPDEFKYALIRVPGGAINRGLEEIDRIWNEVAPLQPVQREFADERIARLWRTMQIQAGVMTFFCSLAIVIGLLGLLGLAAFNAERRTKEIGVRKALGATTLDIAVLLTRQTLAPVVAANLIGWPIALWATMRFLSGFALHVEIGVGPFVLAGLGTVLFTGTVVLLYAVARSRLQPATALRYE